MAKLLTFEEYLAKAIDKYKKKFGKKLGIKIADVIVRDFRVKEDLKLTNHPSEGSHILTNDRAFLFLCGNKNEEGEIRIIVNHTCKAIYTNYDGRPYVLIEPKTPKDELEIKGNIQNLRGYIIERAGWTVR